MNQELKIRIPIIKIDEDYELPYKKIKKPISIFHYIFCCCFSD
jgi:hypothetical protein